MVFDFSKFDFVYNAAAHFAALIGFQERIVILERHAAVGIAIRPEHVGVREQTVAAENLLLAADRRLEAHRLSVELALLSTAAHGSREAIRALQAELQRGMQP